MLLGSAVPASGPFDAASRSCLEETANIIAGAFVGALGRVVGAVVMISVPSLGIEPPDDVLARYRETVAGSRALCIETRITIGAGQAPQGAHLVLLPVGGALEALVAALQPKL
jgi:chemotaxis protein CheY-P-specific phosphatase CheC